MFEQMTMQEGERLLIRAVRRFAADSFCPVQRDQFEHVCGTLGRETYRTLETFVAQLRAGGRRRIVLSVPTDPRLTCDESLMIDAFAAAQIDDYRTLDVRLASLVGAEASSTLGATVCLVAQLFAMNGLWLCPCARRSGL